VNILTNPVLTKELRGRIRGNRALILLTVYLIITGCITMLVYAISVPQVTEFNNPEAGRNIGRGIFLTVMTAALIQVCIITPSLTAGTISGEKERQSYDLLITTLLSPLQIVLGKMTAALAFAMLLIIAALPLAGLSFLFGGVSGTELLIGVLGLITTAVFFASVGMFWSTVMRSTLASTVTAQGSVILMLLGVPFLWFVGTVLIQGFNGQPGPLYVYLAGAFLCVHPFIALGLTEAALISGSGPFLLSVPTSQGEIFVPSPWLVYIFFATIFTIFFLFLSVRLLKPVQYMGKKRKES
jgi:ABC-2 type transport system permease protein